MPTKPLTMIIASTELSTNELRKRRDRLQDIFDKESIHHEFFISSKSRQIEVSVHNGDWKHDHLWARDLMSYLGYNEIGNRVTEEDGSDTYSAEHYFLKNA